MKTFYEIMQREWLIFKEQNISFFYLAINNYSVQLILFFLLGVLVSYIFYKIYSKIQKRRKEIKERNKKIKNEKKYVKEFLGADFGSFNYAELKSKLKELREKEFLGEYSKLDSRIEEAKNFLVKLKHEEELINLIDEKTSIKSKIRELKLEKEKLKRTENEKITFLKDNLNLEENRVFNKSNLNPKEIDILLEEGYTQVNQYCVAKKKVIIVLIKPILNHSISHTFLVWSTRQLLEEYGLVENIREHETRDADLTFRIGNKIFAIEVETGTLLRKKKQLEEKINFLNKKYQDRWIIVVSNRNLVKKYRKFGNCTQRKWVCEKLEKMAGI